MTAPYLLIYLSFSLRRKPQLQIANRTFQEMRQYMLSECNCSDSIFLFDILRHFIGKIRRNQPIPQRDCMYDSIKGFHYGQQFLCRAVDISSFYSCIDLVPIRFFDIIDSVPYREISFPCLCLLHIYDLIGSLHELIQFS